MSAIDTEAAELMAKMDAAEWRQRAEQAETQLAAAIARAEAAEAVLADIPYASMLRFVEAVLMHGQPLQFDVDAVAKWVERNKAQP